MRKTLGLPYKLVLAKLRSASCRLTETLGSEELKRLLDTLFPVDGDPSSFPELARSPEWEWEEETMGVSVGEVQEVLKNKGGKNTAPGRDGIRMKTIRVIPKEEISIFAAHFTRCLREGRFPELWKRALLVLIPKELPLDMNNPKVHPICLLNEIGKIFGTIIVDRITD